MSWLVCTKSPLEQQITIFCTCGWKKRDIDAYLQLTLFVTVAKIDIFRRENISVFKLRPSDVKSRRYSKCSKWAWYSHSSLSGSCFGECRRAKGQRSADEGPALGRNPCLCQQWSMCFGEVWIGAEMWTSGGIQPSFVFRSTDDTSHAGIYVNPSSWMRVWLLLSEMIRGTLSSGELSPASFPLILPGPAPKKSLLVSLLQLVLRKRKRSLWQSSGALAVICELINVYVENQPQKCQEAFAVFPAFGTLSAQQSIQGLDPGS